VPFILRTIGFLILVISIFFSGCGQKERPLYYYGQIASRTATFVKFESRDLDVYNMDMRAVFNKAIDISHQDTAWQIMLSEIEYPGNPKDKYFRAPIDGINYQYCINAIMNFQRQAPKVEIPMFYDVNEKLKMTFYSDSGLVLTDSADTDYFIPLDAVSGFTEFIDHLPTLIDQQMPFEIKAKFDKVNSVFTAQNKELEKKYTLKRLQVTTAKYLISKREAKTDRVQVDCIYTVYNPNAVECTFDATIVLEGKKGSMIHSFSDKRESIPASKSGQFNAQCVLKTFEAERLGKVIVEVSRFSSTDPKVKQYGIK